jgi:mono/diheme cytochrome c family protein
LKLLILCLLAAIAMASGLAGCARKNLTSPEIYELYCTRCHGERGQGDPRSLTLYPHANLLVSPMMLRGDRAAIRQRIAEGYGPMPGFKRRLTPQELERLVDYTLQLGRTPKETP